MSSSCDRCNYYVPPSSGFIGACNAFHRIEALSDAVECSDYFAKSAFTPPGVDLATGSDYGVVFTVDPLGQWVPAYNYQRDVIEDICINPVIEVTIGEIDFNKPQTKSPLLTAELLAALQEAFINAGLFDYP